MILEKDTWKLFVFSFLFTTYIVIGALVFQALEIGNEIKENSFIKATREKLNEKYNISDEDWNKLERILKQKNSLDPSNTTWSFGNAFIFAGSVVTTVGYGNIVPRTASGRLFCIFYALHIGDVVGHSLRAFTFVS
ncbi:two pore potassium channel protein sup-9-like isoform X2 [Oculina patagonica]